MIKEIENEEKKLRECKEKLKKIVDKESVPSDLIIEYLNRKFPSDDLVQQSQEWKNHTKTAVTGYSILAGWAI